MPNWLLAVRVLVGNYGTICPKLGCLRFDVFRRALLNGKGPSDPKVVL
jgi:hypothetical protein